MSRARVLVKSRFNSLRHQGLNRYFHKTILTGRNINFNLFEATKKEKKTLLRISLCMWTRELNTSLLVPTGRHNPALVFIFLSYVLLVMLDFFLIIINVDFQFSLYISRLILRVLKLMFM